MIDLTDYKNWLRLNYTGSEKTVQGYFAEVAIFFRQYDEMTQENVNKFFTAHIDTWKAKTWANYLFRLKLYCKYANITIKFPKSKPEDDDTSRPYLMEKEVLEIADKLPLIVEDGLRAKVFILLLFYTGLRPKEIINLKKSDIDFNERKLIVRKTKTHKDRQLVLPKSIIPAVKDAFVFNPQSDLLFDFTYRKVIYICQRINEMMKPRFHIIPYSFRHGFAHYVLKKCKNDIRYTSKALGHKNRETTYLYTNVDSNEAFEELKKVIK